MNDGNCGSNDRYWYFTSVNGALIGPGVREQKSRFDMADAVIGDSSTVDGPVVRNLIGASVWLA